MTHEEAQAQQQQARLAAEIKLGKELGHLTALLASEDFRWWMETQVSPMLEHEKKQALNVKLAKDVMYIHACRHDALEEAFESVAELHTDRLKRLQDMAK